MLATQFRKNLYQSLEKACRGEVITVDYKGVELRLEAVGSRRKLDNVVVRDTIVGDPALLIGSDPELMEYLEKKWAAEDQKL
jgi:hypothetical protein